MLRSIIICEDTDLANELKDVCHQVGAIGIARTLNYYPNETQLVRVLRAHAPEVVFVSGAAIDQVLEITAKLEQHAPGVQIVAVNRAWDQADIIELMRSGVRELLPYPFVRESVYATMRRVSDILEKKPPENRATDLVYSFLPSKAGVGTSTIAFNASAALARLPDTEVLLMDWDLSFGIIQFMLGLEQQRSVVDAADRAAEMDEGIWAQLVSKAEKLDVLHSGKAGPTFRIDGAQIRHLFSFACRNYNVVCADLSGNMENYSLEIMQESKRIFLVCTPEIPSLHLAREKYRLLKTADLADRVCLLVNRWQKRSVISIAEIEKLLGLPVEIAFANDYPGVNKAFVDARSVDPKSELGEQFQRIAAMMTNRKATGFDARKRFVEYFSIFPTRYSLSK